MAKRETHTYNGPYRKNGGGCYPRYFADILGHVAKGIGKPVSPRPSSALRIGKQKKAKAKAA